MAISDPDTGKVIATPPIGAGSDGVGVRSGHRLRVQLERRRHDDGRSADRRQVGRRSRTSRPSAARERSRWTRRRTALSADCADRACRGAADARLTCPTRSRCWWSANETTAASRDRLLLWSRASAVAPRRRADRRPPFTLVQPEGRRRRAGGRSRCRTRSSAPSRTTRSFRRPRRRAGRARGSCAGEGRAACRRSATRRSTSATRRTPSTRTAGSCPTTA